MLTDGGRKKIWLRLLLIATLCFIWGNSLFSRDYSTQQSGFVLKMFDYIFGYGAVSEHFVRKLAHFTEFAILGAELFGLFRRYPLAVTHALFAALADESLQMLSNRSAEVKDVLLDFSGALAGAAVCLGIMLLVKKLGTAKKTAG